MRTWAQRWPNEEAAIANGETTNAISFEQALYISRQKGEQFTLHYNDANYVCDFDSIFAIIRTWVLQKRRDANAEARSLALGKYIHTRTTSMSN